MNAPNPHVVAQHLEEIEIKRPSDQIIEQIRKLIATGILKPGQRLPPERILCERFCVGRGHVREALRKLEFYGIVKTVPQSGTVVETIGVRALDGLIQNVLGIPGGADYKSLYEARNFLEIHAAHLAAERAPPETVTEIRTAFDAHARAVVAGGSGLDEDAVFHLKIAEGSGNVLLRTLISLLTPDIIKVSERSDTCRDGRAEKARDEHQAILAAIENHDPEAAAAAMGRHLVKSREQHERLTSDLTPEAALRERAFGVSGGDVPLKP